MNTTTLMAVLEYVHKGWAPIPIPYRQKAPRIKDWPNCRLTEANAAGHFNEGDNVGILVGEPSAALVDIDLDVPQAATLAPQLLPITGRIHGRRSKPGSHRWYIVDPIPTPKKFTDPDGTCLLEVRSTGQQTVVPPSVHPEGESVVWEVEGEPSKVDFEVLDIQVRRLAAATLLTRHWPESGNRHEAALALSGFLLSGGWNEREVMEFVVAIAACAGDEEYRERRADVSSTARRLAQRERATGGPHLKEMLGASVCGRLMDWLHLQRAFGQSNANEHLTDLGNARRLVAAHGADMRFCHAWNKWLTWDGARWCLDHTGEVERRAKQTVGSIYTESAAEQDNETRKLLAKWAARSESSGRISAMVDLSKTEPCIPVVPDALNSNPWLLNCANGTIDLLTGELRDHRRENLCTKLVPIQYDPIATCTLFESFLDRIMNGNGRLVGFLQRAIGYALTGSTREHAIFILYGTGANGKTTLTEIVRTVLGDYAKTADSALH
jgi:putative DNA primase/helicase